MNSRNRVLVVDDEPEVCTLLKEALEGENYRITTAVSGEQALHLFANTFAKDGDEVGRLSPV